MPEVNRFVTSLCEITKGNVLADKWLVAPSLRVGYQWLDVLTRTGRSVLNIRVTTLRRMALDAASPEMDRQGLTFLTGKRAELLVDRILAGRRHEKLPYFSGLTPSTELTRKVCETVRDLRLAGVESEKLAEGAFELRDKARAVKDLLSAYENELQGGKLIDYAGVLRLAKERMLNDPAPMSKGALVLIPEDLEADLHGLEQAFWDSIPEQTRRTLPVDEGCKALEGGLTDAGLLRWVSRPADAPGPKKDGTAKIFRAIGEANEVREVFRRCIEQEISFDEVEIVHTDTDTYVPLVFELAARLVPAGMESLPVTFAEGIPTRYSRPGRALAAWVSWITEDYRQSTLVRMLQDGLLKGGTGGNERISFTRLGAILRSVFIGSGRERYIERIDKELESLATRRRSETGDPDSGRSARARERLAERVEGLSQIRELVDGLVEGAPDNDAGRKAVLKSAETFLGTRVRCAGEMDEYCREKLLDEIRELSECLKENETVAGLNIREWLAALPRDSRVGGQGPRPGCIYVSNIRGGGHSGRKHTFIVGLDDGRFPGAGLQDPLLLDHERKGLSRELPVAWKRLERKGADFERLLARLRGFVTLSYSCRDLKDDRETFPGSVVLSAYRVLSGERQGDQQALLRWLPPPASFAPRSAERCIDRTEWWLWRMTGEETVKEPEKAIADEFPHLGRGWRARDARASDGFTEYDGYVPQAGRDADPTRPGGPVLSASRLETLGRCPMEYFFKYMLGIEVPEEYETDPNAWLDPLERGSLLHDVFRGFVDRVQKAGDIPEYEQHIDILRKILGEHVAKCRLEKQPPSEEVFDHEYEELKETARIFLYEEEARGNASLPFCLEAAIGMSPTAEGTPIDTKHPVTISLPGGKTVRARGKIDRLDKVAGSPENHFAIWDYKTGSSKPYSKPGPFDKGRHIQNIFYVLLAQERLRQEVSSDAEVDSFGYFFPNRREQGERIEWTAAELAAGRQMIGQMCEMMAEGCFPFSDRADDVKDYSDYLPAFGDTDAAAEATRKQLDSTANKALEPFRKLRAHGKKKK